MKRKPENQHIRNLISSLKTQASKNNAPIWRRVASELEKPKKQQRIVNFSRINSFAKNGDILLIPGKLLAGGGKLEKKVTLIPVNASEKAIEKLKDSGSKISTIEEIFKSNPKGNKLRVFG